MPTLEADDRTAADRRAHASAADARTAARRHGDSSATCHHAAASPRGDRAGGRWLAAPPPPARPPRSTYRTWRRFTEPSSFTYYLQANGTPDFSAFKGI